MVYCGINNVDINNWDLSATPENSLGLKDGDKVVIQNKDYDIHLQSAVVFVKILRRLKRDCDILNYGKMPKLI